jgi:hypothetical protein
MVRLVYKVAAVDLVLVTALYLVLQDLSWRSYYAGTPHVPGSPYIPGSSYSLLTRAFTMAGGPLPLISPPTLDWVQLIVYLLVVINAWFAYTALKSMRSRQVPRTPGAAAA